MKCKARGGWKRACDPNGFVLNHQNTFQLIKYDKQMAKSQ